MSKYPFFLRSISLLLAIVPGVALTMTAPIQTLGGEAAQIEGFTQADGSSVFALTLKPSISAAPGPRDVVILFSTAASQTGDYRAKSLATLQSLLSKLQADDRVKLVAFDLNATPLTQGFVAPDGPQMAAALQALNRRTPLGACDLEKALDAAAKSYSGDNKSPRAIVYIGDGSSRANVLTTDQLDRLAGDLVAQRAPVIAFGVGPQIQEQLLGALASRSGGVVVREHWDVSPSTYGSSLARAVHGSVFWPVATGPHGSAAVKWPEGMDVYPKSLPPLRSDRDTVLVGTVKSNVANSTLAVEIGVDGSAGAQKLAVHIPALNSTANNGYLVTLVAQAKHDDGRTLPLIDSTSLATARREIEAGGHGLSTLAGEALGGGNMENAGHLATEALRRDPNDAVALAIRNAIAKKKSSGVGAVAAVPGGVSHFASPVAAPGRPGDLNLHEGGDPPPDGAAATKDINETKSLEEQWQRDVQNTIGSAREQVSIDPAAAESILRQKSQDLVLVSELHPEMRDRLLGMLHSAALEIRRRGEEFTIRQQAAQREAAAQKEMEMTNAALAHDEAKVKQLMERYDVLMADGRHHLAEESAALEADGIVKQGSLLNANATLLAAVEAARFTGAYDDIMAVRVARQKGFVDATFHTEKAHVPVADDPPIVYSDAETWRELTARRKERFSSMSLSRPSPAEKKIEEALKQPTTIEFADTKFKDVIDYLKDLHHIEIQLDLAALKESGFDENQEITKSLKGVSLRSALKLLLSDLKLKYVIRNEVLLITTPEKAESEENLATKVYPVAELVLPIKETGFKGGFGALGGNNMLGGGNPGGGNMRNNNPFGNQMGPGNMPPGGNPMGNNMFNNPAGNGLFNVPREVVPRG